MGISFAQKQPLTTTHWHLEITGCGLTDFRDRIDATAEAMRKDWAITEFRRVDGDGVCHLYFVLAEATTNAFTREFMRQLQQGDSPVE